MSSALYRLKFVLVGCLICSQAVRCAAQAPELKMLYPAGGQAGTTQAVEATGKLDAWPVDIWSSCAEADWSCLTESGKLQVQIADNAHPGLYWVRLFNAQGASAVQPFLVGSAPLSLETEPNDSLAAATRVNGLPAAFFGLLNKTADVDLFAIKLEAGQGLSATIDSAKWLSSPADINLQLLDQRGFVLVENLDHFDLDPYVDYQAPTTGDYYVRVFGFPVTPNSTIAFSGGSDWIYRLRLQSEPQPFDTSSDNAQQPSQAAEPTAIGPSKHTAVAQALSLVVPVNASGVIVAAKSTDYVRFAARGNTQYRMRLTARAYGSELDPTVAVLDLTGKQLAQQDDLSKNRDPELTWKAPADAEYMVAISDFHRQGGTAYRYWLKIEEVKPDFAVSLTGDLISAQVGKESEIVVNIDRQAGYAQPIEVRLEGLPETIASTHVVSQPGSDTEKKLLLKVEAKHPFQGPIVISAQAVSTDAPLRRLASAPNQKPLWLSVVP
jgi:hypothetical protein